MEINQSDIHTYNSLCLHYEITARECYKKNALIESPLGNEYLPYLIASLITFDIGRQMGSNLVQKYLPEKNGFSSRLKEKIEQQRHNLESLANFTIVNINIGQEKNKIKEIYKTFSENNGLCGQGNYFHVGATKIMHFMYPELFPIVDSNSARVLHECFEISYRNTTQPGYSDDKYIQSMLKIKSAIMGYGTEKFRMLETGTPITRIFDKLAFVRGAGLNN